MRPAQIYAAGTKSRSLRKPRRIRICSPVRDWSLASELGGMTNSTESPFAKRSDGLDDHKSCLEKAFGNLKEKLNLRRALVSSETSLSGKLFVEFVALIYLSYIKKQMQDNNLFKDYTLQQVLDKLDVIECFENPGDKLRVGEVLSKQSQLYLDLGVNPPIPYVEASL